MENSNTTYRGQTFEPKDEVILDLTGERLKILAEIGSEDDEQHIGPKYLARTLDHKKKTVFACEVSLEKSYEDHRSQKVGSAAAQAACT